MSSSPTATTVVSAFGVTMISPFTMGLATESLIGNRGTGSCAMLDVACTNDSSDHPGLTQVGEETSVRRFSSRAKTLGVRVPCDRRNRLGAPGARCLSSSLPCSYGMTSSIKTRSRVCLIPLVRKAYTSYVQSSYLYPCRPRSTPNKP